MRNNVEGAACCSTIHRPQVEITGHYTMLQKCVRENVVKQMFTSFPPGILIRIIYSEQFFFILYFLHRGKNSRTDVFEMNRAITLHLKDV